MTDMIEAEPALADRILARHEPVGSGAAELARVIRRTTGAGDPVVVTGCGTSEHAAYGVAEILREAVRQPRPGPGHATRHEPFAAQAFELSLDPPSTGSSSGSRTRAARPPRTRRSTRRARPGPARRCVTVSDRSPGAALADIVVETDELDQSWCHTVGYLSADRRGRAVGAHLAGRPMDADDVRSPRT